MRRGAQLVYVVGGGKGERNEGLPRTFSTGDPQSSSAAHQAGTTMSQRRECEGYFGRQAPQVK